MNVVLPRQKMTVDEYLAWAEDQPGRYELVDGRVVAMAPDRARHNLAKIDALLALRDAVRIAGLRCTVFTNGMTVRINKHILRVPDVSVQCDVETKLDTTILDAPLIVVEIVSPSSERKDAEILLSEYFSVPSIQHYLIVYAERRLVIHHQRNRHDSTDTRVASVGDEIVLAPPGMSVTVAALLGLPERAADEER